MSSTESQPSYPTPVRAASIETDRDFPPPPENKETAPFSVLSSLFDRLQGERKPEKRHRLLNSWFNVCSQFVPCYEPELIDPAALAERERLQSISSPEAYLAGCESATHLNLTRESTFFRETKSAPCMVSKRRTLPKRTSDSSHLG